MKILDVGNKRVKNSLNPTLLGIDEVGIDSNTTGGHF